jgi:hypothetical protein
VCSDNADIGFATREINIFSPPPRLVFPNASSPCVGADALNKQERRRIYEFYIWENTRPPICMKHLKNYSPFAGCHIEVFTFYGGAERYFFSIS